MSQASREVANLTERKKNIPPYMVSKNLSVCLWATLIPIISKLAKQNGLKNCNFQELLSGVNKSPKEESI